MCCINSDQAINDDKFELGNSSSQMSINCNIRDQSKMKSLLLTYEYGCNDVWGLSVEAADAAGHGRADDVFRHIQIGQGLGGRL